MRSSNGRGYDCARGFSNGFESQPLLLLLLLLLATSFSRTHLSFLVFSFLSRGWPNEIGRRDKQKQRRKRQKLVLPFSFPSKWSSLAIYLLVSRCLQIPPRHEWPVKSRAVSFVGVAGNQSLFFPSIESRLTRQCIRHRRTTKWRFDVVLGQAGA